MDAEGCAPPDVRAPRPPRPTAPPDRLGRFEYTHVPAGEGLADYPTAFTLLQDAGYDGWLSVEDNGTAGVAWLRRPFDSGRRTRAGVTRERAAQRPGPRQEAQT
jgi:sugar phosphate isomerase/epimerase